jgi:hypothetical protein
MRAVCVASPPVSTFNCALSCSGVSRHAAAATALQAEFNAQQAVCIFRGIYFTDGGPANEMWEEHPAQAAKKVARGQCPPWAALHNFARFFCGMHGMVRAARVWQTSIKLNIDFPGIRQLQNCIAVGWRI